MGNCQVAAADAEAVVIYHPGNGCNKSYKIYRSTSVAAEEIMVLYPGYYVALVGTVSTEEGIQLKQIKLLRPRDTLSVGRVYRLVSFEDVLLELSAKTRGKLVVREGGGDEVEEDKEGGDRRRKKGLSRRTKSREPRTGNCRSCEVAEEMVQIESGNATTTSTATSSCNNNNNNNRSMHGRQWRPSLASISEFGVCEAQ